MKALITGASGTIGTVLCMLLRQRNFEVITWNRNKVPVDNYQAMEDFVRDIKPDVLIHLAFASIPTGITNESWKINYEWTSELAWITRQLGVKFLFTSTNLVFSDKQQGPFNTSAQPDAEYGYGYEKRMAEQRVFSQNPHAVIVRLGWQIGSAAGNNNMIDYLQRQMNDFGEIQANINWKPACSFINDTAEKLLALATDYSPSVYMMDANMCWNFFEIASALNKLHGFPWKIKSVSGAVLDNRMIDPRIQINGLNEHLIFG
ncbi:MAG TPA: sugar nucleotide-binding protein [Chitinophagales bacterium]|nr:sugar nucleotide-binding protein [Chitinophagales bacterium]